MNQWFLFLKISDIIRSLLSSVGRAYDCNCSFINHMVAGSIPAATNYFFKLLNINNIHL